MHIPPGYMAVGPVMFAMMQAAAKFKGRDRRRLKREINKAEKKAKKAKALTAPMGTT
jgi:hypothetical protein